MVSPTRLNGNLSKMLWELARMIIIALLAIGVTQWRTAGETARQEKQTCGAVQLVIVNQRVVLKDMLALALLLRDRPAVGLNRIPPELISGIADALGNVPENRVC